MENMEAFKMYFFVFGFIASFIMVNVKSLTKVNREFFVLIIASLFLLIGSISPETWMAIALLFFGVRTYQKQVIENGKIIGKDGNDKS